MCSSDLYMMSENWGLHGMVSLIDIDTDATVYADGAKALTSTVEIDPVVALVLLPTLARAKLRYLKHCYQS